MAGTDLITHSLGGKTVMQRESDGYISATAMCKAAGKKLNDYKRLENTKEYLEELASITGIPAIELINHYQLEVGSINSDCKSTVKLKLYSI